MKEGISIIPAQIPQQDMRADGYFISEQERQAIIQLLNAKNEPQVLMKNADFSDGPLKGQKVSFKAFKDDKGNILVVHDKAVLGRGANATVLVAQVIHTNDPQIKVGDFKAVKSQILKNDKALKKVQNEDEISRELGLNLSGFQAGNNYYFVMPLHVGESVAKAIPSYIGKFAKDEKPHPPLEKPEDFNVPYFISLFQRMTNAVDIVHQKGVIHLDIKPDNMIENPETGEIKLIDCGESKKKSAELKQPSNEAIGTPAYIPSEFFNAEYTTPLSTKQDIYSLARVFELVMYGNMLKLNPDSYEVRSPSPSMDGFPLYRSSYLKNQPIPNPKNSPDIQAINELIDLVHLMRNANNPDKRPEASEIKARLGAIAQKYEAATKDRAQLEKPSEMPQAKDLVDALINELKGIRDSEKRQQMKRITPMYQQQGKGDELTLVRQLLYDITQVKNALKENRMFDAAQIYSKIALLVEKHADAKGNQAAKLCDKIFKDIQSRQAPLEKRSAPHASK